MAKYVMQLQYRDGTYIGQIPFGNLQGEFRKNKPNEIRFQTSSVDLFHYVNPVSQLKEGLTEVVLYRDNVNIFTGPIWTVTTTSSDKILKLTANDISSYLEHRVIFNNSKFTKKDYSVIAWQLIQDTQALTDGELYITLGQLADTGSGSASWTRKSRTKIFDAVDKLASGTNGFDWDITPERKFMSYYPKIQTEAGISLVYGGNGNIKKYSVQGMGSYVANEVYYTGANSLISSVYTDPVSRAFYGLRHYAKSDSSLKSKAKVDAAANEELNKRKMPELIPQLSVNSAQVNPFNGDIDYGYLINTKINDGWVQFDGQMRCTGYQMTVGKHGQETFVLYLSSVNEILE